MRKRTLFAVCVAMLVMMTGCGNNTQPLGKGNDVDDMSNVFVTSDVPLILGTQKTVAVITQ